MPKMNEINIAVINETRQATGDLRKASLKKKPMTNAWNKLTNAFAASLLRAFVQNAFVIINQFITCFICDVKPQLALRRTIAAALVFIFAATGLVPPEPGSIFYSPFSIIRHPSSIIHQLAPGSRFGKGNDKAVKEPASSVIDNLLSRMEREIIFSLPKNPGQRYRLIVEEDFIGNGDARAIGEEPEYIIYVEAIPEDGKTKPYPVGMITGISLGGHRILDLGWIVVLDYAAILEEIEDFRRALNPGLTLPDTMERYFMHDPISESYPVARFLYRYFTALNIKTDERLLEYFRNAPKGLRGIGIGNAMAEFLASLAPVGSKIRSTLANEESLEALDSGKVFGNTLIGKLCKGLGCKVVRKIDEDARTDPLYILQKKHNVPLKAKWENPADLGEHYGLNLPSGKTDKIANRAQGARGGA